VSRRRNSWAVIAVAAVCALVAAGCGRSAGGVGSSASGNVSPTKGLVAVTPAGTKPVPSVVWAVSRDVKSLDPNFALGYPEFTAESLMYESLLRQAPDGAMEPGLATIANPSPTKFVITLRPGVKFWDGHPVTPADVVYSLERGTNPKFGGSYVPVFNRVKSIAATGSSQVTISLKQPDYWLEGELASMPGIIIEKSFAEQQGKNYGTPAGSIMATGAYMFKSWNPGVGVVAVANPHYWNPAVKPLVGQITLKGVPDVESLTAGLLTGAIQGTYSIALPTLDQLRNSGTVKVYQGPGWSTDAFVVSSLKGVLGDLRVRRALSLALDRQAIISSVYKGAALMPRWLSNPGTFGYGKTVFTAAYDSSPVLTQNLAEAKKLAQQAGATGKTITIGTSSQLANIAAVTGAYQAAAHELALQLTYGVGADQSLITVGVVSEEVISAAFAAVRKRGIVVVTAMGGGLATKAVHVNAFELTAFEKRLQGALFGHDNPFDVIPRMLELYRAGKLKLDELITNRYTLDQVNQGYEDMMAGRNIRGVIIHEH